MIDLTSDLNEQQLSAVNHIHGPLLVIAGAGSGKTRVITYRIANLVANHKVAPWRILAVTFTNKAAKEMRERVAQLIEGRGEKCFVSTFHAACARFLRIHGELIGVDPKFTIYDDSDQKAMISRCLKELDLSEKRYAPRTVQHQINHSKRELISAEEYQTGDYAREQIQKIYRLYEKRMREAAALDFGDLIYKTVRGMRQNDGFREALTRRFDYVLVDEFQDTNQAQLEIVKQLSGPTGNICVVGDDDQSIYSWRGAEIRNILRFDREFPGTRRVTLDRNYRSTANILSAAHGVANGLLERHPKKLWTDSGAGERVSLVTADDEREEARLVARAVKELRDDGVGLGDQAVFYRINAQSRVFEEVFRSFGIPHRVVGGMRFYERAEVKDILSYLRVIQNPGDTAAFLRIVNVPTRGIGKTTLERLSALAASRDISLFDAIPRAAEGSISQAAAGKLQKFADMVTTWREELADGPQHLAERVLADTGYEAALKAQNTAEADARLENLRELIGSVQDFEREAPEPTLDSFLELVTLQSDVDEARFDGQEVTLMTVHSAKGLEFDVVYVTGLEQGMFPYVRGGEDALFTAPDPDEMEEERRLLYVAMTRARKRLFLTRAMTRRIFGQARQRPVSSFLRDVPSEVLIDLTPNRPRISQVPSAFGRRSRPTYGGGSFGGSSYGARSSGSAYSPSGGSYSAPPATFSFKRPVSRQAKPPMERPLKPPADEGEETWIDRSFDQRPGDEALCPGTTVRHARYGVGQVVSVIHGDRLKVVVAFPVWGEKTIIADYLEIG